MWPGPTTRSGVRSERCTSGCGGIAINLWNAPSDSRQTRLPRSNAAARRSVVSLTFSGFSYFVECGPGSVPSVV